MQIKRVLSAAIAATMLGLSVQADAARLKVFPVSIDAETPRATINVVNEGSEPITLEAVGLRVSAQTDIGVFPPSTTIPPGQRQVFRIILPPDVQQTQFWRVRLAEISPREFGRSASGGQVRNELSFEVPVFRNRPGTQADLVWRAEQIRNEGQRQALITRLGDQAVHRYLMPGETLDAKAGERVFALDREIAVRR